MPFGKNARVLRDIKARNEVNASEVMRRAYIYVARNETLPAQVRYQAQLQLNNFSKYQRPTTVKNRCTETGKGRGVLSKWGLCRYQFRLKALAGELPGVTKASW
ncbi:40S ribosomal protein mrp2, mitochondrial [Tulasnella sp. JGI-2019a]|nr:40S ribosomal protein mrp2, mitochondrial [Tulasnella sp. JGI-2019a]KAG9014269.1 40S ribosomal protein mrp2, mitochondrial [Tulasnella sp. JGI-2019a]KAG9030927.1 40S ribosomal protein mrp2, mitochondrial [Tulasnella sp. JGI-2019a]